MISTREINSSSEFFDAVRRRLTFNHQRVQNMTLELLEFVVVVSLGEFVAQDLTKPEFLKALFTNYSTTFYAEVPLSD
jgi:hypothetical protein